MAAVLVDSNVLLDLFDAGSEWFAWSRAAAQDAAERARLVINPIIYAEISAGYDHIETVDALLPAFLHREQIPYEAAYLAGRAYYAYRRRGGQRRSPLPDFFIGAHAAIAGYELLTRDAVRYRTYFPALTLIAPDPDLL
ncbi:MAG TPA: type II toxin-antitoxin system VapC family toxin [Rhizomicrobium sp.]|nr:type II toxin-antitoxin system VapC family toxin [Rhizomicrobium sp.]